MDFFAAQEQARLKSARLAALLVLAVLGIIVAIYLPLAWWAELTAHNPTFSLWNGGLFLKVGLGVLAFIGANSLIKMWQISRGGGEMIAARMGGRLIERGTGDPAERRLINVTEEMAIAAGMPVPVVFVLDNERGLNAFAAGLSRNDSVVCVTRGLLEAMNRDELQGVIGHEISHIVNGDSRLNLKLIGLLYGIYALIILGFRLMTRVRGRNALAGLLGGVLLCLVGGIGWLCGRCIQAAVSREREYLADASAAQFTRHPLGLASALQKLETLGSRVRHPEAAAASHLFFGSVHSLRLFSASLLATHPPLAERIARLGGEPEASAAGGEFEPRTAAPAAGPGGVSAPLPAASSLTLAQNLLTGLPADLRQEARQPVGAAGIVAGLLLSAQDDIRQRQVELLPPASRPVAKKLRQWLAAQPANGVSYRLTWLDLALPCLREMPAPERRRLLGLAEALIRADGSVSIDEFAFYSLLRGAWFPPAARRKGRGQLRPAQLDRDLGLLLGLIARAGGGEAGEIKAAYQAALACSPARTPYPFPTREDLSPTAIFQALEHLSLTAPAYRGKILSACSAAVRRGGHITQAGRELLRAYAQSFALDQGSALDPQGSALDPK